MRSAARADGGRGRGVERASRSVALGLEVTAAFWCEDPARARLLLEGGPSFGNAAHLRLVEDLADTLRRRFVTAGRGRRSVGEARALAAVIAGFGIEIGRLIVGGGTTNGRASVSEIVALARRAAAGSRRVKRLRLTPAHRTAHHPVLRRVG